MNRSLWTAALLALFVAPAAAAADGAALRALLSEHFPADGPGVAVALVSGGRPLVQACVGMADVEAGIPIDEHSLFDLASVSKQYTAAAILLLEQEGKVDPAVAVSEYLPGFAVAPEGRAVTVRDLVWHLSGLPDYTGDDWDGSDEEFIRLDSAGHVRWISGHSPRRAPGQRYEYNNSGYALLARIVEERSGQSFAQFARERLFVRAGMRTAQVLDDHQRRFPKQVRGYTQDDDGKVVRSEMPSSITGDGNVYASLTDVQAWLVALHAGSVLDETLLARAFDNGRLDNGRPIVTDGQGYGYGWHIDDEGRVSHSGSWSGTSTYLAFDPASGDGLVVLSNLESAGAENIGIELAKLWAEEP